MNISAVLIVKDEEKNIVDCLDSLSFVDEIVVVDDNSTDRTIELAERLAKEKAIKIFKRELDNDFSAQRSFGVEKTTNDWVLFVDADERVTKELATEINESLTPNTEYGGFLIPRIDFMWGKQLKHGETGNIKLLRLFDKQKGSLKGKVHEIWETKNKVGVLSSPIKHYPHPTVGDFLQEINFYSDLRSRELFEKGEKSNLFSIIIYTKAKFLQNYFLKRGFLDGTPGFIHAILMSLHSFLVRGKLWLLWQKYQ
ncbi:MAG: Glycosyl transferase family 2 [Microgenomates group bacterium GW2011_GWA2_37_6]|nr:MAG: Glycosyl transferase family 2 [Microgenomates group bacterium GW2011_GWA2_37_6]